MIHGPDGTVLHSGPLGGSGTPTIEMVDRLARLRLELGRRGRLLTLADTCAELAELLELAGLAELVSDQAEPARFLRRPDGAASPTPETRGRSPGTT